MNRNLAIVVMVCAILLVVRALAIGPLVFEGIDDANITFAFAENIAQGNGYVFGKVDPVQVEGSTSLAWTLVLTALAYAGLPVGPSALVAGTVLFLCSALLCYHIARASGVNDSVALIATLLFVCTAGVVEWQALSGMECGLWCCSILFAWYALSKPVSTTVQICAIALLVLVRPEALFYAPLMIALFWITGTRDKAQTTQLVVLLTTAFVVAAAVTVWRVTVFGVPFPNTFYAKVGSLPYNLSNGVRYLGSVVAATPLPWLVLSVVLVVDRRRLLRLDPLLIIAVTTLFLPVITGGDHFNLGRFTQIHWPFLWLAVVRCGSEHARLMQHKWWWFGTTVFLLQVAPSGLVKSNAPLLHGTGEKVMNEYVIADQGREAGRKLASITGNSQKPRVGVIAAGGIALAYDGPVRDLLGLCNPDVVQHRPDRPSGVPNHDAFSMALFNAADIDVFCLMPLSDRRSYEMWIRDVANNKLSFENKVLKGALADPDIRRRFVPAQLRSHGGTVSAIVSRRWMSQQRSLIVDTVAWGLPR